MLSLSNAFDKKDMLDFNKKISNFLNINNKKIEFFCEPKIDGISASLIYENGILTKGLSRGDGVIGEDILENLKTINEFQKKIIESKSSKSFRNSLRNLYRKKRFSKINEKFANPRNAAGGSLETKKSDGNSKSAS